MTKRLKNAISQNSVQNFRSVGSLFKNLLITLPGTHRYQKIFVWLVPGTYRYSNFQPHRFSRFYFLNSRMWKIGSKRLKLISYIENSLTPTLIMWHFLQIRALKSWHWWKLAARLQPKNTIPKNFMRISLYNTLLESFFLLCLIIFLWRLDFEAGCDNKRPYHLIETVMRISFRQSHRSYMDAAKSNLDNLSALNV